VIEADEWFAVAVSNVVGARVVDGAAVGTIANDDLPTLAIGDVAVTEGDSGTKAATFAVSMSQAAPYPVSFNASANTTQGASATAGVDYVAVGFAGLAIPAGQTSKTFGVTIKGDTTIEANESFVAKIDTPVGATIMDGSALGTITNDDAPALTIADVAVVEGNSGTKTATFTVSLSRVSPFPVSFNVATANGSAVAGTDYASIALVGQVIPAGSTSRGVAVTIYGDATIEASENFVVSVSNVANAVVADGAASGTITNDDKPNLSIADVAVSEGDAGTKLAVFTVTLSQVAPVPVTFDLATTGSGSATAGTDYVVRSLSGLQVATGQLAKTVAITINGDTTIEGNETYVVAVSNVMNANVVDGAALGTISNDDAPALSIEEGYIVEGNTDKVATLNVTLSRASPFPVTFDIATATGTADAGVDYATSALTGLLIPAGSTSKTISVTIKGDTTVETTEIFHVVVSNAANATLADGSADVVIYDDDLPSLTIADVAVAEGNAGTRTAVFTIALSEVSPYPVQFDFGTTASGTASPGEDYEARSLSGLQVPAGQTAKTVAITINGDTSVEGNETYVVAVSNVFGAKVVDGAALGTITNDD